MMDIRLTGTNGWLYCHAMRWLHSLGLIGTQIKSLNLF